ncbi:MAG: hypothetical protein GYB31_18985 [Bacteroidetes bacterium]|nr:hypothetical protein [Bacteroidota bacterium]
MILIYGAYGYTGKLIAEEAIRKDLPVILAGRSLKKLDALPWKEHEKRCFSLDNPDAIDQNLKGIKVVLHAAGPFMDTAEPMIAACLRCGTHYLDITGEIGVFEFAARQDKKAKEAGIIIMPGTGFDVVPTDCMALHLKQQMPDATHLKLAFSGLGGGPSRGTSMTMVQSLGQKGAVRKGGKITRAAVGHKTLKVPFPGQTRFCMTIPWGDVSTAYYTTGIPNIETYMGIKPSSYKYVKWQQRLSWLLRMNWVRNIIKNRIKKGPAGPTAEQRASGTSLVWGQVKNEKGETKEARLVCQNGYALTALTSVHIASKLNQRMLGTGFQTPAAAFGADFILEFEGSEREDI